MQFYIDCGVTKNFFAVLGSSETEILKYNLDTLVSE